MKIVHISTLTFGGAGLACVNLHMELLKLGVDSWILTQKSRHAHLPNIVVYPPTPWWSKALSAIGISRLLRDSHRSISNALQKRAGHRFFYSFPTTDDDITSHPLVLQADIIHLHFIARFVDYPSFFAKVKQPIVWTFHDQNPLWGGMHTFTDFDINSIAQEEDTQIKKVKHNAYAQIERMTIICLSSMMERMVAEHPALNRFDRAQITNGIDTNAFNVATNRSALRHQYGIPDDKKIILFVSQTLFDSNKGYARITEAYEQMNNDSCVLLLVGRLRHGQQITLSRPFIHRPATANRATLADYYALSDLFVLASRSETFAQTPIESLSCGTPIVMTPVSGATDTVTPFNGTIATDFTPQSLTQALQHELATQREATTIREDAVRRFSLSAIAQETKTIYSAITK